MDNNAAFTAILSDLGIEVQHWDNPNWVIARVNGIKFELKKQRRGLGLTVAYHKGHDHLADAIKAEFPGFEPNKSVGVYYWVNEIEELQALAEGVRDFIIGEDLSFETRGGRKTSDEGYFEKTAILMKMAIELEHWDFIDRGSCGFDAHDELITIGRSKAYAVAKAADANYSGYREHIVPCVMIKNEFIRLVQDGATIVELAQMLKANLAIVMVTPEEAAHMDSEYKTTMPKGWSFGDSITARLDTMNIAY